MKDLTRNSRTIFSRGRGWLRVNPLDLHRHRHYQHPMAMFVPEIDRELTAITLRQLVPADLGRSARGLTFGNIEAVELQACFIRDEAWCFPDVEIELGQVSVAQTIV